MNGQKDRPLVFRPITDANLDAVLTLNNEHAVETSFLSSDTLAAMVEDAFMAAEIGEGDGYVLCFRPEASYESANFRWFRDRYERFVYVDRIVVAPHARKRGLARAAYEELFRRAAEAHQPMIGCEVNVEPPNPGSLAFHGRMGFSVVGEAASADGGKTVRYLARSVDAPA